jgi:ribosomal protein S18 acetylase RimI-like enzyme
MEDLIMGVDRDKKQTQMVEIIRIVEKDLEDLKTIFEELTDNKCDLKKMAQSFQLISQNQDYIVLGAKHKGKLAGSLMGIICHDLVGECKPFMVIENVIVLSAYRGLGIGKKMMIEIERIGKENNCFYTMFVSGSNRKGAHTFYESLGYKIDEVQGFKKYL